MNSKKLNDIEPEMDPNPSPDHGQPVDNFPIVGIGASAGGLAAFEAFFSGMPATDDPGMAFVLVQHLAPNHKSILSDLVKRYTRMQVFEVEDGMVVKPNCAYIIPPNYDMALLNGSLQLLEPTMPRGMRLPIDFFFRSLAKDQRERAICIVLSGTGSDGTIGIRAVKGEGGMVMAQDPNSTEYDGMPRSATATGLVDYVLAPQAMAEQLINYVRRVHEGNQGSIPSTQKDDDLNKKLFILLRAQTGHDFSLYKPNTINRRIKRRMAVQQLKLLDEYLRFLQQTPTEVEALFRDFLIGVTNFFRDPPVFETLEKQVIPHIFAGKASGATIRVWVPGCSTGEEAYSIAILMQEYAYSLKTNFKLQIFATDIDNHAIDSARSGIFTANIAADISSERLTHYFDQLPDGNFRIHKQIRDMLVFSEHDLIKDPPFSKLDLISCRNVLIYMGHELQKKLIPLFHYGLNPDGVLMLGTSESVGDYLNLFTPVDRKAKIYKRKLDSYSTYRPALMKYVPTAREQINRFTGQSTIDGKIPLRDVIERALLQKYAPTAMLVNERGDILYLHGRSGRYLEPAQGDTLGLMNVVKMAREGLKPSLTTALHRAVTHHQMVSKPGLRVKTNGDYSNVNLIIQPISFAEGKDDPQNIFMIILEETVLNEFENSPIVHNELTTEDLDERVKALKQELRDKEEFIQSSNEELETTNEELKSSNEEMQSVNEELQSTNEELETAKEELQSVNEELATVNTELQQKVLDLTRVNNDMNNLLASTGVGTIFVDHQLMIQRFTASITPVINLIASDVGRPVGHIVSNLVGYSQLVDDVKNVLTSLIPRDVEVQTTMGIWYLLRIQPYRTVDNVIEGAVITFTDITELKKGQAAQNENDHLRRQAKVIQDATDPIVVQDMTGKIINWNPAAEKLFGWTLSEAQNKNIREMIADEKRKDTMNIFLKVSQGVVMGEFETAQLAKNGQIIPIKVTATSLSNSNDEIYAISATEKINVS